jgi:hypothetical protein
VVDKSWGLPQAASMQPAAPLAGAARERSDRLARFEDRAQARAASREAAAKERERERDKRRQEEQARRAEGLTDRTPRPRRSGRTDVVGVQRHERLPDGEGRRTNSRAS